MKRSFFIAVTAGILFSLALPFCSIAGNVHIQTKDGYAFEFDKPYSTFFIDSNGNLSIMMDATSGELLFSQCEAKINIQGGAGVNNSTGIVNGTKDTAVTFDVEGVDSAPGAVVTLNYLGTEGQPPFTRDPQFQNKGIFTKTYTAAGTYIVSFGAVATIPGAPNPDSTVRTIQIVIADPQACTSTVTAQVTNPAGGTINPPTSVTDACGRPVTFSGTLTSGYTGGTVTPEGSFHPNGLYWSVDGITTPSTPGGSKTVSITFTGGAPPSTYTLTVSGVGAGGSVTCAIGGGTPYTYTAPVTGLSPGTSISLQASPSAGYTFNSWTTPSGSSTANPYAFTIAADTMITANFATTGPSTPCSTVGTSCSSQLASAVSLNFANCDSGIYGYILPSLPAVAGCYKTPPVQQYTVLAGATVWFLVDASVVGKTVGLLQISVLDYAQGSTHGAPQAWIYPLDASNNLTSLSAFKGTAGPPYQMSLPYGQGSSPYLPVTTRYLVKITEAGAGVPLTIVYK